MLRGNNGQTIFFSDSDRCRLCLLIQQGIERFDHSVHAFCFMKNHVHLVIQTGTVPLSRIIQHLAFRYARYINRKQNRIGHLFQGRFKAILVDDNDYLLKLVRYVHVNPVRAGITADPKEYLWSSHRTYLGIDQLLWLCQNCVLLKFHSNHEIARERFETYTHREIK
jgi:REP element-mobilizing transposase RayT